MQKPDFYSQSKAFNAIRKKLQKEGNVSKIVKWRQKECFCNQKNAFFKKCTIEGSSFRNSWPIQVFLCHKLLIFKTSKCEKIPASWLCNSFCSVVEFLQWWLVGLVKKAGFTYKKNNLLEGSNNNESSSKSARIWHSK